MIGQILGYYRILQKVGSGGMGDVYRARDSRLERDVAIKILRSASVSDPDRLRRFEQEARAAASLNHPTSLPFTTSERMRDLPTLSPSC